MITPHPPRPARVEGVGGGANTLEKRNKITSIARQNTKYHDSAQAFPGAIVEDFFSCQSPFLFI